MPPISAILLIAVMSVGAKASQTTELQQRPARQSSRDVLFPKSLVSAIEAEYKEYLKSTKSNAKTEIKRRLMNVDVELTQDHPGALFENVKVVSPLGGGVIDLADFVAPTRGSFQLRLLPRAGNQGALPDMRVFFVSRAKSRQIDGDSFGAGCNKYMDVTGLYHKVLSQKGLTLYTADQRYLSVIGGAFLLVGFTEQELFVASVSLGDSRYQRLLCTEENG